VGLLSHENADIVIDVVEVVHELTDEDVGNEAEHHDDDDDDDEKTAEAALKLLIEGLVSLPRLVLLHDYLFVSAGKFNSGIIG
jgi:beta-catenin-like protein 1